MTSRDLPHDGSRQRGLGHRNPTDPRPLLHLVHWCVLSSPTPYHRLIWHDTRSPRPLGDIKAGTLIGVDKYGNKFFENTVEELPLRTRWVDYKSKDFDA